MGPVVAVTSSRFFAGASRQPIVRSTIANRNPNPLRRRLPKPPLPQRPEFGPGLLLGESPLHFLDGSFGQTHFFGLGLVARREDG